MSFRMIDTCLWITSVLWGWWCIFRGWSYINLIAKLGDWPTDCRHRSPQQRPWKGRRLIVNLFPSKHSPFVVCGEYMVPPANPCGTASIHTPQKWSTKKVRDQCGKLTHIVCHRGNRRKVIFSHTPRIHRQLLGSSDGHTTRRRQRATIGNNK